MGGSTITRTNSTEAAADTDFRENLESQGCEMRFKPLIRRMLWDFALGCLLPHRQRRRSVGEDEEEDGNGGGEHNKAWLLAESGGCGADEPHSVHSSFRFSFCSDVEVESAVAVSNSSCTVLMVNLDNGFSTDSKPGEQKWRRIESLERSISPVSHSLIRFTYPQITSATRNFSKGRVLGRGALSCVFRGRVGIVQRAVAIKCLDKEDKESSKAFCRELMIASSLHDTHIVPLLGFCIDAEGGLFLVYKFVSGGSLDRFLHEKKKKKRGARGGPALPWLARYKVAIGIAEAIEYLHYGTERCVVHRDIKPSNILLSSRNIPKLCDFGLATWTPAPSVPFLCKTVKGTFGYLAPEYFQHGKVSDRTDVYAFGVVLLELITGRKPIESKRGPGEESLVSWAKPLLEQGSFGELLDSRMELRQSMNPTVGRMVQAAAACLSNEPIRPEIGEVVTILRGSNGKSRKKEVNSSAAIDSHSELRRTRSEMKSHFALAMLGVEFEDDDHLYSR